MGWGAKKAALPQPDRGQPIDQPADGELIYEEPAPETPEPNRLAEVEFMRLQANKGWTAERRYDVLRDFVRASGLYLELNKFVRKMR